MATEIEIEKTQIMMQLREELVSMTEKQLLIFIALKLTIGKDLDIEIHQMNLDLAQVVRGEK